MEETIGWACVGLMVYGTYALIIAPLGASILQLLVKMALGFRPGYVRSFLAILLGYALVLAIWFIWCCYASTVLGMLEFGDLVSIVFFLYGSICAQAAIYSWLFKSPENSHIPYSTTLPISGIHLILTLAIVGIFRYLVGGTL